MASSVFFKFKSHKEHTRVTFDGTGITVFDLKREIITLHRLGDGTDFNLHIYNEDTNEEYDDDTTVIPRSTSVIARRLPPAKPGKGTAHRYVSSKMPVSSVPNAQRQEKGFTSAKGGAGGKKETEASNLTSEGSFSSMTNPSAETEEERIAAMFQANSEVWNKTQEHMASATPIHRGGPGGAVNGFKKNFGPVPSHPPPQGYICYRCGEKGHWIQACPTNADPTFDGRPRVKRTTGIPRSFLKTVEKPALSITDTDDNSTREIPGSVMVNAEGEYVIAEPDKASWETYQQKTAKSSSKTATAGNEELQREGLECTVDHKLFKDAVKTPCCGKIYCEECIQSLLFETDFVCPNCDTKDILLDMLIVDLDTRAKVEAHSKVQMPARNSSTPSINSSANHGGSQFPKGVDGGSREVSTSATPTVQCTKPDHKPSLSAGVLPASNTHSASVSGTKKRPFDELSDVNNQTQIPSGPKAMRMGNHHAHAGQFSHPKAHPSQHPMATHQYQQFSQQQMISPFAMGPYVAYNDGRTGIDQFNQMNDYYANSMNNTNGYPGVLPSVGQLSAMGQVSAIGMGIGAGMGYQGPNTLNTGMIANQTNNMYRPMGNNPHGRGPGMGSSFAGGMSHNQAAFHGMHIMPSAMSNGINGDMNTIHTPQQYASQQFHQNQQQMGYFTNQQKTVFSEPFPNEEESPYIRKPVNPHRHARPKRIRPSDFKALGGEV